MLWQEMHIEIDLKLKKLNSNSFKQLLPEEKDWFLTLSQLEYINSKRIIEADPNRLGLERTKKRYEDLKSLYKNVVLPIYSYESGSQSSTIPLAQYAILPPDFYAFNSESVKLKYDCKGIIVTETDISKYIVLMNWGFGELLNYNNFTISTYNGAGAIVTTLASHVGTIYDLDAIFQIKEEILFKLNKVSGLTAYWEDYNGTHYDGKIVMVFDTQVSSVRIDAVSGTTLQYNLGTGTELIFKVQATTTTGTLIAPTRLTQWEDYLILSADAFAKTSELSVLATLENKNYIVYRNSTFIANELNLVYIRNPKPISSSNNWNCEIDETKHHEIVDIAVKKIAGYLGMKVYQVADKEYANQE